MATVRFEHVRKVYENGYVGVDDADFEIAHGEMLVLVGPSGCGKSTLLRMVAGLETITAGTLSIGGRVVNEVSPRDRDIAMVFQNYALYPHMSVADNLAFGLRLRGTPKAELERRVADAAAMLDLGRLLPLKPAQLSGGQRQRVALGRALVRQPAVFLLDEPLSNLDAKLRLSTRVEIAKLHRAVGATMIYVTHDQIEAMTLGQRIVVMRDGRVQQIDAPMRLYERPANAFVATFVGSPKMNLLEGPLCERDGTLRVRIADGIELALAPPPALLAKLRACADRGIIVGLRPEHLHVARDDDDDAVPARVESVEPVGNEAFLNLDCGGRELVVRLPPHDLPAAGDALRLGYDAERMHFFEREGGRRIDADAP
ncbi:ABC transporter ATP-binding protein [Dokdonella fugitiva]|jgi:multiple sugar transport system ATP-binding protein|uniref:Multiple sugar transport system ATP-binding protein n=1 Tax=Dokdonella fugitiva TaxID=328517 RepID=A0A4R2I9T7_9GAMM|nr:sn-glycerol-3-phosphate ABC transporter ATP-binding protein UgpC [Dokdonella fugitiva]MBA8884845.1 multiple sugar transport system ATP-binding protein [Dokdonella fugitiva]TCO40862.1 multiple sugar transport system ATP-binding protein [Dokdonella fugitiva]